MHRLSEWEIEKIMEGHDLCTLKSLLYLSRPNYFKFIYKQDKEIVDEVFDKVKWEMDSYPCNHHHNFYNFLGTYLAIRGHNDKAEEYFLEAVRLKPGSEVTLTNYLLLLCDTRDTRGRDRGRADTRDREKAAVYFKRLNETKQGSPEVKLDLAVLFQLFNLNVAARVLLEDYITNSVNANEFVMFMFGRVLMKHSLGKMFYDVSLEKAIKVFHDINKRSPSFLPNTDSLVKALNHKWKSSQKSTGKAHPHSLVITNKIDWSSHSHPHALYLQGKIRMRVGQLHGAKEALQRSVEQLQTVQNRHQLGKCHMALAELRDAEQQFKEAQKLSVRFIVKLVLKEAATVVEIGRRIDGLRLINRALEQNRISNHDKMELELFSAEQNIVAFPEVVSTLDEALRLLYQSFSRRLYRKFIKVVKLFTEHLSRYYVTTGLPHGQVETLLKWAKFLEDRGEITAEKHAELLRVREGHVTKQHGRRVSTAIKPHISNRRSSVKSCSSPSPAAASHRTSPDSVTGTDKLGPPPMGSRIRRRSSIQAPLLTKPDITTSSRSSFILSLDSNNVAEEE